MFRDKCKTLMPQAGLDKESHCNKWSSG